MRGAKKHPRGFTLLEMVVATALFTVFMVAAADIYLLTSGRQNRSVDRMQVVESIRPAIELLSRDIREAQVDYSTGWLAFGPLAELRLRTMDDSTIIYRFSDSCAQSCLTREVSTSDNGAIPITPDSAVAVTGAFYVQPLLDPYHADAQGQYATNQQPQVTVWLQLQSLLPAAETIWVQTTITTRTYGR